MKQADREIIDQLNRIYDAQAAGGGASFASLTGSPSDNAALGSALDAKQSEAEVQAIADAKVESEAYGPDWNGDTTHAPSKNDVYDKIEAVVASIPVVSSGTYTPTVSAEINLSVTPLPAQWMRVGNVVTVSGAFQVSTTLTLTATSFRCDVPVSSNISNPEQAGGAGAIKQTAEAVSIYGMGTDLVIFEWKAIATGSEDLYYSFTYQIL